MDKSKVFVIMPFEDKFFEMYEMLKIRFSDNFEFSNAADEGNQQNILKDIIQPIYNADIIIADLTGFNPNVMYELGLAHTFNKKTIVITQDDLSQLPFDLKLYRAKAYTTHFKNFNELIEYLDINLNGAINKTVSYSNPVKDFLSAEQITNIPWFLEEINIELNDDTDKGFFDFLADIESNTQKLTENINNLSQDMQDMSDGISKSTEEINRVNKSGGGSGTASFVRKESKKAAKHIDTFANNLRERNKVLSSLWDEIEKNTLGLIENKFATNDTNKPSLIEYLSSLKDTQKSITESNESVEGLKTSMTELIGLEHSMTQAIKFVIGDVDTYLSITERIKSSIDKILDKSKFVVGEI